MIAKNSSKFILIPFTLAMISFIWGIFLDLLFYYNPLYYLSVFIFGFTLFLIYFFRDPKREILVDPSVIYAPADGTVLYIDKTDENVLFVCCQFFNIKRFHDMDALFYDQQGMTW